MKKKNWLLLLLIALCLAAFFGYRALDRIRTDTRPPEITVDPQPLEISVEDPQSVLLQGVSARDNADGDVTASLVVESVTLLDGSGNISVRYAAFDSAGNVAKADREARYTDYQSPRFTLSAPLLYPYGHSFDIMSTIGVSDVIDGDIQHRIRATSTDSTAISALGTHEIQFQVTNSLRDTVTVCFPVEVYAADSYNASLSLTDYLIYLPAGAEFQPKDYLDSFTAQGKTSSLKAGMPENFALNTRGQVMTSTPGVYTVEYRVTYTDRNETNHDLDKQYTGYSKLIVVVEG